MASFVGVGLRVYLSPLRDCRLGFKTIEFQVTYPRNKTVAPKGRGIELIGREEEFPEP